MSLTNLPSATSKLTLPRPEGVDFAPGTRYLQLSSGDQQLFLSDYWRVLIKRRWAIAASVAFTLTAAIIVSLHTTRMYQAIGQITINRENPNPLGLKDNNQTDAGNVDQNVELSTQVKILQSNSLASQVIGKLQSNWKQFPGTTAMVAANNQNAALEGPPQISNDQQAQLVEVFKRNLAAAVIPETRLVEIHYSSPEPRFAADAVNTVINTYIDQNLKTRFASTTKAADWLGKQLSDLQGKVEISEAKLVRYQKEHGILGTDEKQNIITSRLEVLNKDLTDAEGDRIQKEAVYGLTKTGDPETVSAVSQNAVLQSLRTQQADLQNQLAQATVRLGSAFPKVVELRNRMEQLDSTINAELKKTVSRIHNDYAGALAREKMLRQALELQKQDATRLNENAIEYNLLRRDADSNRQLYESLLQKLKEASVSAALSSTNVRIVEQATPPRLPFSPDIPRNLAIGLLVGLTSGIGLAFVLEALDNTVRTPEQAETIASLPSLAVIPLALNGSLRDTNNGRRLLRSGRQNREKPRVFQPTAYTQPRSETAEAYRALRTSILLSSSETPPKVILVTSALPGEGKTTTSVNSAIVLAQEGRRVLLVDADLRRPSIDTLLGVKATAGLATVLTGNVSAESAMIPSPQLPTLFVLPAGLRPPHPSELLGSARMKQLLAQWCEMFDYVIIDSPPALTVTDAVRLSVETHAVMLVVRSGQTGKGALRRTSTLFSQVNANVLGIVVNAIDLRSRNYYYSGSKYAGDYYEAKEEASA